MLLKFIKIIQDAMRLDSCTKCGTELEVNEKCDVCREANQFFCHNCGNITEKQIHFQCDILAIQVSVR